MKAIVFLALVSLVSCNNHPTKKNSHPVLKKTGADQLQTRLTGRLSILSNSALPEKLALRVNGEDMFDECFDVPEFVQIDRDLNTIDTDFDGLRPDEKLDIKIFDRGADCLKTDSVFYVNERVDYDSFDNKWEHTHTLYAHLNNYPVDTDSTLPRGGNGRQ